MEDKDTVKDNLCPWCGKVIEYHHCTCKEEFKIFLSHKRSPLREVPIERRLNK